MYEEQLVLHTQPVIMWQVSTRIGYLAKRYTTLKKKMVVRSEEMRK